MTSLRDIGKLTEEVTVGKHKFIVTGISAQAIATLLEEFPAFREFMADREKRKVEMANMNPADIIKYVPNALGHIIAAGIGKPGDKEEIAGALEMPVGVQMEFLQAIIRVTFPRGWENFQNALAALIYGANKADGASGKEAATS